MAEDPVVAVLLLNFRQPDLVGSCLEDLARIENVTLSVLLIDNGSADGSGAALAAMVREFDASESPHRAELLQLDQNLGFSGGMNRGIQWAAENDLSYSLVLNNDVRLPADSIRPLVNVLHNDARVGAVGPTVLHPDGTVWAEGGQLAFAPNGLRLRGHGNAPRPRECGPEEVSFLPCACVMFRTADLEAIDGFDERYFMYWEDVDLCERLHARGGRIVWLPWVRIEHAAGSSSGGGRSPLRKHLMACNAVRYLKSRGTAVAWAGWLLFDVMLWPLAFVAGPRGAMAKLRGTLAGLRGHRVSAADVERLLG